MISVGKSDFGEREQGSPRAERGESNEVDREEQEQGQQDGQQVERPPRTGQWRATAPIASAGDTGADVLW